MMSCTKSFPNASDSLSFMQKKFNEYVGIYMEIMFQPIVEATKDIDILNLTMKIICEAILENIYNKQIKFTVCGALNLLKDFEGIAEWIENNKEVPEAYREKLMKHEVLKYCEGVGKILLREPDEVISMFPSPTKAKRMMASSTDDGMLDDCARG
jgi:Coiled-coil protein 142